MAGGRLILMHQLQYGCVELELGDIVDQDTDAIVNAANSRLAGGGGVDGAIHRAAGPELAELCRRIPADEKGYRCPTGDVRTTAAGRLKAKIVIHAVGPFYNEREAEKASVLLRQVHQFALDASIQHDCASVAFPAISTGAYRFPVTQAANIAIDSVCHFLQHKEGISLVRFVLFQQEQYDVFADALDKWQTTT